MLTQSHDTYQYRARLKISLRHRQINIHNNIIMSLVGSNEYISRIIIELRTVVNSYTLLKFIFNLSCTLL